MTPQIRDKFYDEFLKEPTKDNFRNFLKGNCGELDEVDFKEQWIDKGHLAKTILAMANSRGGIIVIGSKEKDDGTIDPVGLEEFKDKVSGGELTAEVTADYLRREHLPDRAFSSEKARYYQPAGTMP